MDIQKPDARAESAEKLVENCNIMRHESQLYIPIDYETEETLPQDPTRTVWQTLQHDDDLMALANREVQLLFATPKEVEDFRFQMLQRTEPSGKPGLLIKTPQGLRHLNTLGQLEEPDGSFRPHYLLPLLNQDSKLMAEIDATVTEWVGSQETAHSLLRHLATALDPTFSAGKAIFLLGEGRNGKSVLMHMLSGLFGRHNISHVSRQQMVATPHVTRDLNGSLLNVIYDGSREYVSDSSREKSLTMGEEISVRMLYGQGLVRVRTNALFVEGLNDEPLTKDKSSALQKRYTRFWFPNVYKEDRAFFKRMISEPYLGAFLALLMEHWVTEDELETALAPSTQSQLLNLQQKIDNSNVLQFVEHTLDRDAANVVMFKPGANVEKIFSAFNAWSLNINHTSPLSRAAFTKRTEAYWTSGRQRVQGQRYRVIETLKQPLLTMVEEAERRIP